MSKTTAMQKKRRTLYQVQRGVCVYCGILCKNSSRGSGDKVSPDTFTIDHIVPKSLGGSDSMDNLVGACAVCNVQKSSSVSKWLMKNALAVKRENRQRELRDRVPKYHRWTVPARLWGSLGWIVSYLHGLWRVRQGKMSHGEFRVKIMSFNSRPKWVK